MISQSIQAIPLSQYNARIRNAVAVAPDLQGQWVLAETSDVSVRRGHCYLELVEKQADTGVTVAKVSAVIWANTFASLNARFQAVTGANFATGMKVMVRVNANFHEQYGLKLVVTDINPEFTIGDMERQRREILTRLQREGLIERNRQLPWPTVPQRIAVVSAAGAAGYGDFMNQLRNNPYGLQFYTCLFQAMMQGANTVPSVLAALQRIEEVIDLFDCVVIIRGGGATTDLNSFDNYELARRIAEFAKPVIVGIGHERDVTVLDYVAAMRVKTPTAAAEWLIGRGSDALSHLNELRHAIVTTARDLVTRSREQLAYYTSFIPAAAQRIVDTGRLRLDNLTQAIPQAVSNRLASEHTRLGHTVELMQNAIAGHIERQQLRLAALTDKVTLLSPQNTLSRGYALVKRGERCVTDAAHLGTGEHIVIQMRDGSVNAQVN
ncbi:MAG: exodeoxyribonuclease VII large subunit [Muribaculaceae bacterium]|nr:exodeoxyribonuclease VII large subunit [Muribaculaceae bacterium]